MTKSEAKPAIAALKASLERRPAADLANPAALYGRIALLA